MLYQTKRPPTIYCEVPLLDSLSRPSEEERSEILFLMQRALHNTVVVTGGRDLEDAEASQMATTTTTRRRQSARGTRRTLVLSRFLLVATMALIIMSMTVEVVEALPSLLTKNRWFTALQKKKKQSSSYTPLLFFTVPPGLMPECDAVEKTVREIEKELGVTVQRMDVLRNPANEAVLNLLSQHRSPPFLYHRESCQTVVVAPAAASSSNSRASGGGAKSKQQQQSPQRMPVAVDKERIRAWAKGRYLTKHSGSHTEMSSAGKQAPPIVLEQEDSAMDQAELLEDMALTPEQLRGKRLMQERTNAKSKKSVE